MKILMEERPCSRCGGMIIAFEWGAIPFLEMDCGMRHGSVQDNLMKLDLMNRFMHVKFHTPYSSLITLP